MQNITCGVFFPLSFCQKIPILYQNQKILEYVVFEFYLAVWHVRSIVNFKNSYFPSFSNSDTKLVFLGKNWVGKIPHKWYFAKTNQIIPISLSTDVAARTLRAHFVSFSPHRYFWYLCWRQTLHKFMLKLVCFLPWWT